MSKESILFVHNYYQIGGGEHTVFENEAKLLQQNGHRLIKYTRSNDELRSSWSVKLLLPFSTLFSLKTFREVRRIIDRESIEIVHCHNTFPLISPAVYYAAWSKGVPVLQTIHNFRFICPGALLFRKDEVCEFCIQRHSFLSALAHRCYRNSWLQTLAVASMLSVHRLLGTYKRLYYCFLTEFNRDKHMPVLKFGKEQAFIKPNFSPIGYKQSVLKKADLNKFIFVGRLEKNKGIMHLIEAWKSFPAELVLHIAGDGPLKADISKLATEHHNIICHGFLKHDELLELWGDACALIFSSIWYEGFPMTIVESFALGVPVIVNHVGNAADLVVDGQCGYHMDVRNPQSIHSAIDKTRNEAERLRKKCREEYALKYSPENNYEMLHGIYRDLRRKEASND